MLQRYVYSYTETGFTAYYKHMQFFHNLLTYAKSPDIRLRQPIQE